MSTRFAKGFIFFAAAGMALSVFSRTLEMDVRALTEGCRALPTEKRTSCIDALARVTSSKVQSPAAPGVKSAKEPVSLRGVLFDDVDARDALTELCVNPPQPREDLRKSTIWCKFDTRGMISMPGFEFGNLRLLSWATVNQSGALVQFESTGEKGELLKLAALLTDKYGQPQVSDSQVANRAGTKFDRKTFVWVDSRGTRLTVESIYDKIDSGRVVIESKSHQSNQEQSEKRKADADKGKL